MACDSVVIWDEGYLAYDFGDHPLNPIRLDLTMRLSRALGVLERVRLLEPVTATDDELATIHAPDYLDAVRRAGEEPGFSGYGLGTDDDPVFPGMYHAAALIAGGSAVAARELNAGRALHAVNIAGGLHHAMPDHASGFCIFNDCVLAINELLDGGATKIAYVDIDVHHGDGVQAAFYDDPRVLTISLHQDPRTLFPGTGFSSELGSGDAIGTAVNVPLPPGTGDSGWLRAFDAVVPGLLRAFAPDILVTQNGCDTHHDDPLANMELSVDGQRAAIARLHRLAHEITGGRWLALGGGGYGLVRCVPRTWTHLLAVSSGEEVPLETPVPAGWSEHLRELGFRGELPDLMGEQRVIAVDDWQPGAEGWLDRAVTATRVAAYPLHGLDPYDPRD